jgi:cytidylate kinase
MLQAFAACCYRVWIMAAMHKRASPVAERDHTGRKAMVESLLLSDGNEERVYVRHGYFMIDAQLESTLSLRWWAMQH